ncbi:MAG TPA: F420-0--gamma-glutamyl ligase [Clostridia bacterium]|nr:F420-0--gamma-glutamyl ligase [Clostridia bacterium]
MTRMVGTTVRGIRAPIVKAGDDLVQIVVESVLAAARAENFTINDRDIVAVTESLVARAQGNYATVQDIAADIGQKFTGSIGVVFPILSRNRFAVVLKGIALSGLKIYLLLNYPADEVGNHLMDIDRMEELGLNPYRDVLSEARYRELFGQEVPHMFTGVDYVRMYKELAQEGQMEIILGNDPRTILSYTDQVLVANIHERHRTKRLLQKAGARVLYTLDEILTQPRNNSGFNPEFGLLGSNAASEDTVKLFPRNCDEFVLAVQQALREKTGKHVEVMVYGDGAFKDPVGKIWELADPVVSPGYTPGLAGTPNEIKLKYLADTELKDLTPGEMQAVLQKRLKEKETIKLSLGTTPRRITDLVGSLCDLTSGSGDKGTPIVLVQGYFDNYASE